MIVRLRRISRPRSLQARTTLAAALAAAVVFGLGAWTMRHVAYDQRISESVSDARQEASLLIASTTESTWPAGGAGWVQRFPDATAVETAIGFGTLSSSQIAFSSGPQSYIGQAFAEMAGLMLAAGLTPKLQFGEILWWFQANTSGMAFYDADTGYGTVGARVRTGHRFTRRPTIHPSTATPTIWNQPCAMRC